MVDREPLRPLHSSRADDPRLADAIAGFAVGVAERIDHLQDADRGGDLARLAILAGDLARDAGALGYESLAEAAHAVARAARSEKADEAHARLRDATELAQRVRLGHPGAF
jgi:hypothetical protein